MAETTDISFFLKHLPTIPLLDVRSEGEYRQGHIPGAINIPLLNNEQRALVGTVYKQEGREQAVLKGFELVGPSFRPLLEQWLKEIKGKQVMVYCWRGGMRSNIAAWMLSLCGIKVSLLKGGYKSYRHWTQQQLILSKKVILLGGPTGAGKTELLFLLKAKGEQTIDLEFLVNHKGSAFGGLGMPAQPSYEHFENLLALQWSAIADDKPVWIENESRMIGTVKIPDTVFEKIATAPVILIDIPREIRLQRILQEYGQFPVNDLVACTLKLKKRLGDLRTRQAVEYLEQGEMIHWLSMLLDYYDNFHTYNASSQQKAQITTRVIFNEETLEQQADKLIQLNKQIHGIQS